MERVFNTEHDIISRQQWTGKLFLLACLLLMGLGVLVFTAFLVTSRANDGVDIHTQDNRTWFVSQLAVDAQRLQTALTVAELTEDATAREDAFNAAKRAFDIYYSRVDTLHSRRDMFVRDGNDRSLELEGQLEQISDHLVPLTELVDSTDSPDPARLADISRMLSEIEPVIKNFSLNTLHFMVANAAEQRKGQEELLRYFVAVAISMFFVLSVAAFLSFMAEIRLQDELSLQSRLRSSLDKVVSASHDGIVVCNALGQPVKVNETARALFRIGTEHCSDRDLCDYLMLHEPDPDDDGMDELSPSLVSWLYTMSGKGEDKTRLPRTIRNSFGGTFSAEVTVTQDINHASDETVFIIFIRDVTEAIAAETELRAARDEALRNADVKTRFLSMMGHEMRTPLHCAITALDLIQIEDAAGDAEEMLKIARNSTRDALQQVDDVLERTSREDGDKKEEPGVVEPTQIVFATLQGLEVVARERNTVIEFDSDLPEGFTCKVLPMTFRRAFRNIAQNAVKFTENGTVRVELTLRDEPDGSVFLVVSVDDTGIGIHQDDQDRIFEDFEALDQGYNRRANGVGLGLGIAYRAISAMGGKMDLVSAPGVGSSFTFEIPVAPVTTEDSNVTRKMPFSEAFDACKTCEVFNASPLAILVVDDYELNRRLLGKMLVGLGYEPDYAKDGVEAVSKASERKYDLILMDISMPVKDGVQATRAIRTEGGPSADARITAVTANALIEEQARFVRAGMDNVLPKPVSEGQLNNEICLLTMRLPVGGASCGRRPDAAEPSNGASAASVPATAAEPEPTTVAEPAAQATGDEIDMGVFSMLAELLDEEELQRRIDECLGEVTESLACARRYAPGDADCTEVAQMVHKSAGVAAMIGAPKLHRTLCQLEDAIRGRSDSDPSNMLKAAETSLGSVKSALKAAIDA
ncbi:hypothetical protein DKT77_10165 [Meridianimarinicoccus roseus]|uniref:histidine kinase n=1 Tax=Meridianimarinicoccus roseus TaxID=2072018 RepID=A0A2V2LBI5_9RHOB|nr:ATP-binding protein [Meridianimarinicoccus roseus]PWR02552.1 hypothetical protein DKT77_10165 [Meridianimarinicoccus roseus]